MTLNDFKGTHLRETLWIIGKGPSLDLIDMGMLKHCTTAAINDVALCMPVSPTYVFLDEQKMGLLDGIREVTDAYVFYRSDWPPPENDERVVFWGQAHACPPWSAEAKRILSWYPDEIAERNQLYCCTGTVHQVIHFAKLAGYIRVNLVGFDPSITRLANCVYEVMPNDNSEYFRYMSIYQHALYAAAFMGIAVNNVGQQLLWAKTKPR